MKATLNQRGLFVFVPLVKWGLTIYPNQMPQVRSKYWALYDYIDHVADLPNKRSEAELWSMLPK